MHIPFHHLSENDLVVDDFRDELDKKLAYENIQRVMGNLGDREKIVILMRFWKDSTLDETARELGISRERVRQIEAKALRKLRHPSRSKELRKGLIKRFSHVEDDKEYTLRLEKDKKNREQEYYIACEEASRLFHERRLAYLKLQEEERKKHEDYLNSFIVFIDERYPIKIKKHPARERYPSHFVYLAYDTQNEPYLELTPLAKAKGYHLDRNLDPESYDRWLQQAIEDSAKSDILS